MRASKNRGEKKREHKRQTNKAKWREHNARKPFK
jgi:hypothetical protein